MNWGRKAQFIPIEFEEQIIQKYQNGFSIKALKREYNFPIRTIANSLKRANVYRINDNKSRTYLYRGENMIAKCKITGKTFDYTNFAGQITNHIKTLYPNALILTGYESRKYYKKYNKFWYENFNIEIVPIQIEEQKLIRNCHYCNWTTLDVDNKSGCYRFHIENEHNISIEQHIIKFPNEKELFKTYFDKLEYSKITIENANNFISCPICEKQMRYLTNTHLKTHNITRDTLNELYGINNQFSKSFLEKTTSILKEAGKNAKNNFISKGEIDIAEFIEQELGIKTESRNKKLLKGIEIDIVIPEYKIGIEYNGCFYHTEKGNGKTKQFHLNKTKLMKNEGYRLVHIFEDDWIHKQEIVKHKLKHILNKNVSKIIHARKCSIETIDSEIKKLFLDANHIQGNDNSNLAIALKLDEIIIAVMTFDNKRQMSNNHASKSNTLYELTRFAVNKNYRCPGAAGKLLSYFLKNYKVSSIISFADLTWSELKENNLYEKLGFKLVSIISPDYKYFNPKVERNKRLHKFGFGKSHLKKRFPNIYDDNKTEWEIMQEAGFDRIWDCGKLRYELQIENPKDCS